MSLLEKKVKYNKMQRLYLRYRTLICTFFVDVVASWYVTAAISGTKFSALLRSVKPTVATTDTTFKTLVKYETQRGLRGWWAVLCQLIW